MALTSASHVELSGEGLVGMRERFFPWKRLPRAAEHLRHRARVEQL